MDIYIPGSAGIRFHIMTYIISFCVMSYSKYHIISFLSYEKKSRIPFTISCVDHVMSKSHHIMSYNTHWCYPSSLLILIFVYHDDVIKWKHFPRYWSFMRGIHRSPWNSPHKGQWRGALMFSLIYTRINGWVNNSEAGDLRRHRAHYNVTVMLTVGVWSRGPFHSNQNGTRILRKLVPVQRIVCHPEWHGVGHNVCVSWIYIT